MPVEFDKIEAVWEYLRVIKDNKIGLYDFDGNQLTKIIYDRVDIQDCGRKVFVSIGNRNGYLPM